RLDDDRGRAPTLDDLRFDADSRLSLAIANRPRRSSLAPAVYCGLSADLSGGARHHASPCLAGPRRRGRTGAHCQRPPARADRRRLGAWDSGKGRMMPALDLVPIWTTILAVGVFLYVALDGFDLGVGMLYIFAPDRRSRDLL